jgi:hypothetical protein
MHRIEAKFQGRPLIGWKNTAREKFEEKKERGKRSPRSI